MRLILDQQRQDSACIRVLLARIAENIVLFAVPMQIEAKIDFPLLA
jgi:hypothetical protein